MVFIAVIFFFLSKLWVLVRLLNVPALQFLSSLRDNPNDSRKLLHYTSLTFNCLSCCRVLFSSIIISGNLWVLFTFGIAFSPTIRWLMTIDERIYCLIFFSCSSCSLCFFCSFSFSSISLCFSSLVTKDSFKPKVAGLFEMVPVVRA